METDRPEQGPDDPPPRWPRQQVYFVSVDWLDAPHQPESPERLAQAIRQLIEHAHAPGPDTPPARFVVRVKADEVTSSVTGTVVHHHHHHHPTP
jgi:hypothetical protein